MRVNLELVTSHGSSEGELARLDAAMALWADLREHGSLYFTNERISSRERGRIHWAKTMRTPMVMSGLNPVYPFPIHSQVGIEPLHPLTTLHRETCDQAGSLLGWLKPTSQSVSSLEALKILDVHRDALFQDRHRRIWSQLKRFHSSVSSAGQSDEFRSSGCLATSFPNIWERMVQVALGPWAEFDLPKGTYHLDSGKDAPGLRLLPDLIIDEEGMTLVIDAKDYSTGKWPSSESINKQIMYRLFLTTEFGGSLRSETVHNLFVRPMVLQGTEVVRYLGSHAISRDPRRLGRIHCFGLDFESAAAAYVRGRPVASARTKLAALVRANSSDHLADRHSGLNLPAQI